MAIKDISEVELAKTLAEVGKELESLLKAESERLAKFAGGPESTAPAEETAAAAPAEGGGPPDAAGGPPPEAASAAPAVDAGGPPPDAAGAPPAEGGEGQPPDFSQLADEELKQAYLAIKQEIMKRMQSAQGAGAGQPPAAPPQAGPPQAPPDAGVMKNQQEIVDLRKALDDQKKLFESQQKQIELTATVLSKALNRPQRKAVTDATNLVKSEPPKDVKRLPKKEVQALLKPMVEGSALSKSDREAVNSYCFGYAGFEAIEHLFKK